MTLAPSLTSPTALYRKLERESYRALHSHSRVHKADHFFNFCVTAHAMRDYVLEYLGKIKRKDQQPFHDEWSKIPALVAVKDIANCSKHFVLRDRKTTNRKPPSNMAVRPRRSKFVDVYSNGKGKFEFVEVDKPDISIKLSDDTVLLLHELTHEIMSYWREYLSRLGITVRRQPVSQLIGNVA